MFEISVEHVLMFMIAIFLLLILVKKTNTCQKICNNGFKVGGQIGVDALGSALSTYNTYKPRPPPPPSPCTPSDCNNRGIASGNRPNCRCECNHGWLGPKCERKRPPLLSETEDQCNEYFSKLATICPEDHVDNMCCKGNNTIWGLEGYNSLSASCIDYLPSINVDLKTQIEEKYEDCLNEFPDIHAENTIFTVFTDINGVVLPIYLPILQKLEMIHRKTGKKTYEIISGSNLQKYNRLMNYIDWSKQNNMDIYTHENDSDGFTVGGQAIPPAPTLIGTVLALIGAGVTCTQYFIGKDDEDKQNCERFASVFATGCFLCYVLAEEEPNSERNNVARRLTTAITERKNVARKLTSDQLSSINRTLEEPVNQDDMLVDRPELGNFNLDGTQLTQEQVQQLRNPIDAEIELTEAQEAELGVTENTEVGAAQVFDLEGVLIEAGGEVLEVDEELAEVGG